MWGGWAGSPGERGAAWEDGEPTQAAWPALLCLGQLQVGTSLSLHTQMSWVGAHSSTGEPKWPVRGSKSAVLSVGLVIAYRREK